MMMRFRYMFLLLACLCTLGGYAQKKSVKKLQYSQFMTEHITTALELDGERKDRFSQLYVQMLADNKTARGDGRNQLQIRNISEYTDQEVERKILRAYELSVQLIQIKERYYHLFREVLSPREIALVYDIEQRGRERFAEELKRRKAEQMAQ